MALKHGLSRLKTLAGIMHGSRAFSGPYQALFNVSNRCNTRCIHCIFHSPELKMPNLAPVRRWRRISTPLPPEEKLNNHLNTDIDPRKAKDLIDQFTAMGTYRFQFSGCGEPFLNRSCLDILQHAKDNDAFANINTNGVLLRSSVLDSLVEMNFDELQVTAMAGSKADYMRVHPLAPESEFTRLEENLLYLKEIKLRRNRKWPKVSLCFVVIRQNCSGIVSFAEMARKTGADRVLFRPFFDVNDPALEEVAPLESQLSDIHRQLREADSFLTDNDISHNIGNFLSVFQGKLKTAEVFQHIPCVYGWLSTLVDVNGDVYSCCRCDAPLGNLYEKEMSALWYGGPYRDFRRAAKGIKSRKTPVEGCDCHHCANFNANISAYRKMHPLGHRSLIRKIQ